MSSTAHERDDSAAACGVLKVISDDWTRWHFESKDDPNVYHTVDLTDWDCSGSCSCPHFEIRIRPLLERRVIRPHDKNARCKHIMRADRILCYRVKKQLLTQRNQHPNPNPNPKRHT